ncbi:hypothetical protein [Quadrisphaera sp. INWT6]|uniref:hypothetical protein n=1 Tax=Quadrisphaera sp. INWT6 TaxID=2596917 RepID=UPI0018924A53|nr:hypothetical protein [Quadrisphaera sp. INWT6]MBF5082334.1 hypothetical protein [Quadrisphaera sp. INWT6]
MKYERTPRFDADFKALSPEHQRMFREAVPDFAAACDAYVATGGQYTWPRKLRVAPMKHAPGIWEMTWSFASPDGRATFAFTTTADGETRLLWRRVGYHGIYKNP